MEGNLGLVPIRSQERVSSDDDSSSCASDVCNGTPDDTMAALLASDLPKCIDGVQHYFVPSLDNGDVFESSGDDALADPSGTDIVALGRTLAQTMPPELDALLELLQLPLSTSARP